MQLNKHLAHAGLCSRRKAVQLIESGHVTVNDTVITHPGYRVTPHDIVYYKQQKVTYERPIYVLFNKPKGCVTTRHDERDRATVFDYIAHEPPLPRMYPVGRLDYNSTGLLVLTNDGELTHRLQHPAYGVPKQYQVTLHKPLAEHDRQQLLKGVHLSDGFVAVDDIAYSPHSSYSIRIYLHSGRKRVIRRMLHHFGYYVEKLDRPWYAGLTKKGLARGSWRFLSEHEVACLQDYAQFKKGT